MQTFASSYELNLRKPDERQCAWMMVQLSAEPGENLLNETFNGWPWAMGREVIF